MAERVDFSTYYRRITAVSILAVAREVLGARITVDTGTKIQADCPHHASSSKTSLHFDEHRGLFWCFGCRVGGDVLQFVEWFFHGVITKRGPDGRMTDTHREARDWLADKAGLPKLGRKPTDEDGTTAESRWALDAAVFACMTDLARVSSARLLRTEKALAWSREKWGLSKSIIESLKVGLGSHADFEALRKLGHDPQVVLSTGLFHFDRQDNPHAFFEGRIVFPYWLRGQVRYNVGRHCPLTPDTKWERAKYKKQPCHDDNRHAHVSPAIDNKILWGEDVLLGKPRRVVLTEGVVDAILIQEAGFACVSPVTVRMSMDDSERIVRAFRACGGIDVVIVQDNEVSGIGMDGALATARLLTREGVSVRIAQLPLRGAQEVAREELKKILGDEAWGALLRAKPADRGGVMRTAIGEDAARLKAAEGAADAAKIDVAEWFRTGGTPEEFGSLLNGARPPLEVAADMVPIIPGNPVEQVRVLAELFVGAIDLGPAESDQLLRRVKDRTGLPMSMLRAEAARARKGMREAPGPHPNARRIADADPGTCRAVVEQAVLDARMAREPVDWSRIAELVFRWIEENGGRFFRSADGAPSLFLENDVWRMSGATESGPRQRYIGLMYRLTGLVPASSAGRTLYQTLAALAADRGEVREEFGWILSDVASRTVHFALCNKSHELVRISPEGVAVVQNGANEDGIILRNSSKISPIDFDPDADDMALDSMFEDLIGRHLACPREDARIIRDWMLCMLLIEFTGTKPFLRLEGPPSSGKTFASKLITVMVYGSEQQVRSTEAAAFTDAARNPLVALDNMEAENATRGMIDFFLLTASNSGRQKRAMGTDSDTTHERPNCLVLSTGVEPLGGELQEVMTRTFLLEFDERLQGDLPVIEPSVISAVRDARSTFWSAAIKRCAKVLALLRDGARDGVISGIRRAMGPDHSKKRCDEFLSLMYLQRVAAAHPDARAGMLERIDDGFLLDIRRVIAATATTAQEASPISTALVAIFNEMRAEPTFATKTGLRPTLGDGIRIERATSQVLFLAFKRMQRDRGVPCPFINAVQLGKRLSASARLLRDHGISVESEVSRRGHRVWNIEPLRDADGGDGGSGCAGGVAPAPDSGDPISALDRAFS